jgi:tetratricopeptide (TPR) repeat protein
MLFDPDRMKSWAKWVYLGLAVVFASGVVLGGVGGGVPYDISDIVGDNAADGTTSSASIEDLEKRTAANPKDVDAWRELSGAYQAEDRPEDAISALEKVVELQPKDTEAQQSLANLLLGAGAKAARESNEYFSLSSYLGQLSPTAQPFFGGTSSLGLALQSPFQQAEANSINVDVSRYQQKAAELSGKASEYYQRSLEPYKQLTDLRPNDAQIWLFYGDAASQANDATLAIANYSKFLELAPDDIDAPRVKEIVKQLESAQSTAGATATETTPATTVTVEAGGSTATATS